jgi:hypothetical protein
MVLQEGRRFPSEQAYAGMEQSESKGYTGAMLSSTTLPSNKCTSRSA